MSLIGSRGRFSKKNNKNIDVDNLTEKSSLSSIGSNPNSLFNIPKKIVPNEKIYERNEENIISKRERYNKEVENYNKSIEKDFIDKQKRNTVTKKKISIKTIIAMIVVELITLGLILTVGSVYRFSNMTQKVEFNKSEVKNTNIDNATLELMSGYKTVAVFGLDSRTGSVDKGNNSDVNIIVNLDLATGEAQLASIFRDLYLNIPNKGTYDKLNSAYRQGGPEGAVKTINKNFDLNIQNFFSFNWKAVADGIELLGGVDLEISKSEFKYLNAFIHETCIATGIDSKNPAGHYIKNTGVQHLDGVQAVAYGRLRLMDSDFQRTERQKKIITICLEKAKKLDVDQARQIMEAILPQIAFEFDMDELLSIIKIIKKINITESLGVPEAKNVAITDMGPCGDCIVPINLEKAVKTLHQSFYKSDDYKASSTVRSISVRITELRKKYAEENENNESTNIEELIEEIENEENGEIVPNLSKVKTSKKVASKSNVSKSNNNSTTIDNVVVPDLDNINNENINNNEFNIENNLDSNNNTNENNSYKVYDVPGGRIVDENNTENGPMSNNNSTIVNGPVVTNSPSGLGPNNINNAPFSNNQSPGNAPLQQVVSPGSEPKNDNIIVGNAPGSTQISPNSQNNMPNSQQNMPNNQQNMQNDVPIVSKFPQ